MSRCPLEDEVDLEVVDGLDLIATFEDWSIVVDDSVEIETENALRIAHIVRQPARGSKSYTSNHECALYSRLPKKKFGLHSPGTLDGAELLSARSEDH